MSEESEGPDTDKAAEEFEHDINSLCVEEDFEMANFDDAGNHNADTKMNPGPSGQIGSSESVDSAKQQSCSQNSSLLSENNFLMSSNRRSENLLKGKYKCRDLVLI